MNLTDREILAVKSLHTVHDFFFRPDSSVQAVLSRNDNRREVAQATTILSNLLQQCVGFRVITEEKDKR